MTKYQKFMFYTQSILAVIAGIFALYFIFIQNYNQTFFWLLILLINYLGVRLDYIEEKLKRMDKR